MLKKSKYLDRVEMALAIYNAIQASGYTQAQVARKMGVNPVVVTRWATGRHIPDTDSLVHLADVIKVDVNDLLIRKK